MMQAEQLPLSEPAKLLLLLSILANDRVITQNGRALLKELVIRRDPRLLKVLSDIQSGKTASNLQIPVVLNALIAHEAAKLYSKLFDTCTLENGKALSKTERERKSLLDEKSLIYGEVEFSSFYEILMKAKPKPGGIFYDLGSGTGRAVMAARLTQDFAQCIGIEILSGLCRASQQICAKFKRETAPYLHANLSQEASCVQGSFLDYDWSDGDLVFANSTCFDDELMRQMSVKASKLKPGALFITFTKPLESDDFAVLEKKRYEMSWGPATVFLHERLPVRKASVTARQPLYNIQDVSASSDYHSDSTPAQSPTRSDDELIKNSVSPPLSPSRALPQHAPSTRRPSQSLRQQALSRNAVVPRSLPAEIAGAQIPEVNSSPLGSALLQAKARRRSEHERALQNQAAGMNGNLSPTSQGQAVRPVPPAAGSSAASNKGRGSHLVLEVPAEMSAAGSALLDAKWKHRKSNPSVTPPSMP